MNSELTFSQGVALGAMIMEEMERVLRSAINDGDTTFPVDMLLNPSAAGPRMLHHFVEKFGQIRTSQFPNGVPKIAIEIASDVFLTNELSAIGR